MPDEEQSRPARRPIRRAHGGGPGISFTTVAKHSVADRRKRKRMKMDPPER